MKRKKRRIKYPWMPGKSVHHIVPRSRGGDNRQENLLKVRDKLHYCFHALFGNKLQHEVLIELIDFWYKGRLTRKSRQVLTDYLTFRR